MANPVTLSVEVELEEDPEHTEARMFVRVRDRVFGGFGRAKRNPTDANIPMIGEELAMARAFSDLSQHLMEAAARAIEEHEGHHVQLHL